MRLTEERRSKILAIVARELDKIDVGSIVIELNALTDKAEVSVQESRKYREALNKSAKSD
ncbi:MAG: hypothetical protein HC888_08205 [Candidatus Competibacteraceae bacterium]|nr:hypothetical protein [Candidatus Competibacteraceae bacterium]